jgi:hypothetical protein
MSIDGSATFRIGGDEERAQQPGCQIAARRHRDAVGERDRLAEIEPVGGWIVNDDGAEHIRMNLADEHVQPRGFQHHLGAALLRVGVERHVLRAGGIQQAGHGVHGVRLAVEAHLGARPRHRQRLRSADRSGGVAIPGAGCVGELEFDAPQVVVVPTSHASERTGDERDQNQHHTDEMSLDAHAASMRVREREGVRGARLVCIYAGAWDRARPGRSGRARDFLKGVPGGDSSSERGRMDRR